MKEANDLSVPKRNIFPKKVEKEEAFGYPYIPIYSECLGKREIKSSDESRYIFPFNFKMLRFEETCGGFEPEKIDSRMEMSEVRAFFNRLEESTKKYKILRYPILIWGLLGSQVFLILVCGYCLIKKIDHDLLNAHRFLALILCVFSVHFLEMLKKEVKVNLLGKQREVMLRVIREENFKIDVVGLRWVLTYSYIDWIELWMDYKLIGESILADKNVE